MTTDKLSFCDSFVGVVLVGGVSCFLDQGHFFLAGLSLG